MENQQIIAVWRSRSGKHFVALTRDKWGLSYRTNGGGGNLGNMSDTEAVADLEQRIVPNAQPDSNKSPMIRVA
jgi:hypothetical protein